MIKRLFNISFTLLVTVCCLTILDRATAVTNTIPGPQWIKDLLSANAVQQKRAVSTAADERAQSVSTISGILKETETADNRTRIAAAIRIAGTLRAAELTQELVNKIDFLEFGGLLTYRPSNAKLDYIAVDALIKIGQPSIKPIIERLSTETEPLNRLLLVTVIKGVEGAETGNIILERAIQQSEGKKKESLQEALKLWQRAR